MSTIITAFLIVITAIGIPLIFIYVSKKKSKKRNETLLRLLTQKSAKRGLSFTSQELLRSRIIGFDSIKQTLLVFDFENPGNIICITMAEIENCTVEKKYDSIVIGTERKAKIEPHIRSIDLKCAFKNGSEPVSVSFYDSGVNSIYEMSELEAKAKTWEAVLSKISKELKVNA